MQIIQKMIFSKHLDDGEKLFEAVHKHWIEILPQGIIFFLFGIIGPIAAMILIPNITWWWWVLGMIMIFLWFLYNIINWYFDAWLITNYSILHVEWRGFFERESSRIEYGDVKEVGYVINGVIATSFDFGDMVLLSVSGGRSVLHNVPHPKNVEILVREYKSRYIQAQRFADAESLEYILGTLVQKHIQEYGFPPKN